MKSALFTFLIGWSLSTLAVEHPTDVYWGDTHVHTALSGDAFANGTRLEPLSAYQFARGEEVKTSTGQTARLTRSLDFIVVADHGNNIGAAYSRHELEDNPDFRDSKLGKAWLAARLALANGHIDEKALTEGSLLPAHRSWQISVRYPLFRSLVWERIGEIADQFNEPGRFTAFIGYEWTPSFEEGRAEHRVILFRDSASLTDQVLPFTSYDSAHVEDLWSFLSRYEAKTGGRVISIPHNSNLTSGAMFAIKDSYGFDFTPEYANLRARFEPLVEATQIKGDSETHPFLSPDDSFADFETWNGWNGWGNLVSGNKTVSSARGEAIPYEYVRSALKLGLTQASNLDINPFKLGMIGSTDSHTALASADDANFWGKMASAEPSPDRIFNTRAAINWQMNAAGYAAVWALDNTREALFEAMERRETYASTGPRMTVRFFGGYTFSEQDADARDLAGIGYAKGVPMGGDLYNPEANQSPSFLIAAMKDPLGANLDRIQVVKGWRSQSGQLYEKIYDVAVSDSQRINADGSVRAVGDTVDRQNATYSNSIGTTQMRVVWQDPNFNPDEMAFYYARILQIPTPRWTLYDVVRYGLKKLPEAMPLITQERAYTSPIWYTPE